VALAYFTSGRKSTFIELRNMYVCQALAKLGINCAHNSCNRKTTRIRYMAIWGMVNVDEEFY